MTDYSEKKPTSWERAVRGTYLDSASHAWVRVVFLAVVALLALLPSIGMLWAPTDSTTENRELAAPPVLFEEDGSFNVNVLADAGACFEDHFAYRNQLVSANARLRAALGTSPTDQVVVGTEGWLYYGGTLSDYLGSVPLSERALRNIAHNLALAQDYVEAHGASFAFTIAPNKNTLYPQNMPAYYLQGSRAHDARRLVGYLREAGVNYVDLFTLFEGRDDVRYLKTDSHWDNQGALLAADELLGALSHDSVAVSSPPHLGRGAVGDLASMLFPEGAQAEPNWYYDGINDSGTALNWSYEQGADVTDDWITTRGAGEGGLLVFRDSFGNALLPFLASSYGSGTFSKLVPYNVPMAMQVGADAVVIERAERHLGYLAESAFVMPSPRLAGGLDRPSVEDPGGADTTLSVASDGPYLTLSGVIDARAAAADVQVYVGVTKADGIETVYDAFWTSSARGQAGSDEASDFGYRVLLNGETNDIGSSTVSVYAAREGSVVLLKRFDGSSPGD